MDFSKHSLIFFKSYKGANPTFEYDFLSSAFEYIRGERDFKYKDQVEAELLIDFLVDLEYFKLQRIHNSKRQYIITEKGNQFLLNL